MLSPRAALSFSLVGVSLLSVVLRAFVIGPLNGSTWGIVEATLLISLVGSISAVWAAASDRLRGRGERLALIISLLVTALFITGAVGLIAAVCALASP